MLNPCWLAIVRAWQVEETPESRPQSQTFVTRFGQHVIADEAYFAWTRGDLDTRIKALSTRTNLIDRHHLLMSIVREAYKNRKQSHMVQLCALVSELHLSEFSGIAPALRKDGGEQLPRVTTFQFYATLLSEQGRVSRAIEVCEMAIKFGLQDSTKSGFIGRIGRIQRISKQAIAS